ncbi:hypothetical protein [Pseudactinotalea sp. HY158]|uniref:hypothetical protein n=1 Tax=Pseudactinotalea sp. HY158 TaxID=2654547 RepID=UPI00129CF55E|nr:hypothetical protein [Pseudactinotalea sp. HY158]QGH68691.1 hypothetical protein GCE65_03645 [Pseudactinotalea sp. HY158]
MEGTLLDDTGDPVALRREVHRELVALRGAHGRLTVQKFNQYPVLRRICGGGDLLDAFLMFERELRRYQTSAGRDEAAAAISIVAPAETVLDRLEYAVSALPQDGELRDQRTARRWSDAGLRTMADELTYMAEVQGRLGQELINIEVGGTDRALILTIEQLTTTGLPSKAPLVRVWHYDDRDEPTEREAKVDLEVLETLIVSTDTHTMRRYHLEIEIPKSEHTGRSQDEPRLLGLSMEGRDAPMRSISYAARTPMNWPYQTRLTTYRTIVLIEVIAPTDHIT